MQTKSILGTSIKTMVLLLAILLGNIVIAQKDSNQIQKIESKKVKFHITNKEGSPLAEWRIYKEDNKGNRKLVSISDAKGYFTIDAKVNDILHFRGGKNGEFYLEDYKIDEEDFKAVLVEYPMDIKVDENQTTNASSGGAISTDSYWLGATIGYNLAGQSSDDIVGSAKIVINPMSEKWLGGKWGIIGNFSNFQSVQNKKDLEKSLRKVAQGNQGLFLGLSGLWDINEASSEKHDLRSRVYFTSGARLNSYSKVGIDTTTENLMQFRSSLGFETEGFKWGNEGRLNLSFELAYSAFDKGIYKKIFMEERKELLTFETTLILPIAKNTGIMFDGTFSKLTTPVFLIGIIFKTAK